MVTESIKFIAEIGLNHNGNLDLALQHILSAKDAGANVAKFQTYFTQTRPFKAESLRGILESCELTKADFTIIKNHCESQGIEFCSTPFCVDSVELLSEIDCEIFKIASFHMNNYTLIQRVINAPSCKRLIISTGLSTLKELEELNLFLHGLSSNSLPEITILHCISQYPSPSQDLNLANIHLLQSLFKNFEIGYSDHSIGSFAASYAVMLGAKCIEKHFTVDNSLPGADHAMSASPSVFSDMVTNCLNAKKSIGNYRSDSIFECESSCLQFQARSKAS